MVASRTGNTVTTVADHTAHVIPRLPALGFGGDWNPEQWPSSVWDEDLRLMREAHVNLVTLGVFSWAYLEPTPGRYEFGWLDTVLDKCLDAGCRRRPRHRHRITASVAGTPLAGEPAGHGRRRAAGLRRTAAVLPVVRAVP